MRKICFIFYFLGILNLFGQPPNGFLIDEGKYLDKTEIAIIHWREFMYYVENDSTEDYYNSIIPDSTILSLEELVKSEIRYHPVIGLNRWQMEQYCIWRTEMVNNTGFELHYRLPTELEWRRAFELGGKRKKRAMNLKDARFAGGKLKHMDTNVSELIHDAEAVLGNNWRNTNSGLSSPLHIDSNRGHDWVGFRCIAIMNDLSAH